MRYRAGILAAFLMAGCGASPQVLGLSWRDDAARAAADLGLQCEWTSWSGGDGFEHCESFDKKVPAFGTSAYVGLFRREQNLEAVALRFTDCEAQRRALRVKIRGTYHLEGSAEEDPYAILGDESLVHFSYSGGDDTCTLTVAGPRFGKAFSSHLLAQGLGGLFRVR